jgi:hypothetical protein
MGDGERRNGGHRTWRKRGNPPVANWRLNRRSLDVDEANPMNFWVNSPKDQLRTSRDCMGQMTQSEGFLILSPSKSPQPLPSGNETRQLKWIKSSTNLSKSQTYFTKLFQARPTMDDKPRSTACFPSASVAVGFTKPKKRNMSKPSGPRWFVTREVRFPKGEMAVALWNPYDMNTMAGWFFNPSEKYLLVSWDEYSYSQYVGTSNSCSKPPTNQPDRVL